MPSKAVGLNIVFDISHNNGIIDWPAVAASFPNGAIVEIKASQGTLVKDSQFERNFKAVTDLKWPAIPYHFCNSEDPSKQWDNFNSVAQFTIGSHYMLDWERYNGDAASITIMNTLGNLGQAVTKNLPIGYWGLPEASPSVPSAFMATWPRQIPRYRNINDPIYHGDGPGVNCFMYQYTQWGRISGIENGVGNVDRSVIFSESIEEVLKYFGTSVIVSSITILRPGITGDNVRLLQDRLNANNDEIATWIRVDGIYGEETKQAVFNFQKNAKLEADGIAGPLTLLALEVK